MVIHCLKNGKCSDTDDNFYELDIFKGDFSPLIQIPDVSKNLGCGI
ncbi:hypothetical protein [Sphingobacterium sp. HMA12]